MKFLAKSIIQSLFLSIFLSALVLGTFVFRILDKDYLFEALVRSQVYETLSEELSKAVLSDPHLAEEERMGFSLIFEKISSEFVKQAVEENLGGVLDYLHGESTDLVFEIPLSELGVPELTENFRWSLSEDAEEGLKPQILLLNGSLQNLMRAWSVLVGILTFLLILYGVLSRPKVLRSASLLLLPSGLVTLAMGLSGMFFISQIPSLQMGSREPAQILIDTLLRSFAPGIFTLWLTIGLAMIAIVIAVQALSIYSKTVARE